MKKIILIVAVAAISVGAWLLLRHKTAAGAEEETKPVAQVQLTPLRMRSISATVPAFGIVEAAPSGAHSMSLGYDCIVTRIPSGVGSRVAAGDVVIEVAPTPDFRMQLESAKSASALADKALSQTRERYELRLATNQDVLTAQQAADDGKIKLASFQSRGLGGDGRVAAPESGIVTRLDWQVGATVPAGTPLAVIAASAHLEAHLAVEVSDASRVQTRQNVTLKAADRPGANSATAAVRLVGSIVDPITGAVDVRVPLSADSTWFAGEHVLGAIEVRTKTALVAPRSAVLPDDNRQVLFTVKDRKAVKHVVQTGIAAGNFVEVISADLKAGDSVVSTGNYELDDGMEVEVAPAKGGDKDDAKPDSRKADDKALEAPAQAGAKP